MVPSKGKTFLAVKFVLKRENPMKEEKKDEMMYRLPPNFTERASPAYIDYKLIVTVQRGVLRVTPRNGAGKDSEA
jgi:hypothetical protein